jgi:hypothetical protein
MGKKRNMYRLLVGKPDRKRPLGRPRWRWMDNNEMDLAEILWCSVGWISMAQDGDNWRAHVNVVMKFWVP